MTDMPWWRVVFATSIIALLFTASAYDIVRGNAHSHWPFSAYSMYARTAKRTLSLHQVYGVKSDGAEFPLLEDAYFAPVGSSRTRIALTRMRNDERRLDRALRDVLRRYELGRLEGHHDGPPIEGIRFYRDRWVMEPDAGNRDRPDRHELVREITQAP